MTEDDDYYFHGFVVKGKPEETREDFENRLSDFLAERGFCEDSADENVSIYSGFDNQRAMVHYGKDGRAIIKLMDVPDGVGDQVSIDLGDDFDKMFG